MAGPSIYAKGSPLGSDQDWYHGQLSRVEAEQALTASGCDCFLVRESQGALVLSLIHHGQVHHVNIKYEPGGYELESGSATYSFIGLEELVSHYCNNSELICGQLKIALGVPCKKREGSVSTNQDYSKGSPAEIMSYPWHEGNISEKQAFSKLKRRSVNLFLVRESGNDVMLSTKIKGWISHAIIHRSPEGYRLEGKKKVFSSIQEMIAHYQQFPIKHDQVLAPTEAIIIDAQPPNKKIFGACESKVRKDGRSANIFKKSDGSLRVSWGRGADLPVAASSSPIVKIGSNVYVGSGLRNKKAEKLVFKYSIPQGTWSSLPNCPSRQHSLVGLDGELIALGGQTDGAATTNSSTNFVYTFRGEVWQQILPPMPTARRSLSAMSYLDEIIIAAGGITTVMKNGEPLRTDIVEIYKKDKNFWCITKRLPFPLTQFSMHVVGNTCYTLGGTAHNLDHSTVTLYATVPSLLENAVPAESDYSTPQLPETWDKLHDKHPLFYSSLVELDGRLVAMGGSVDSEHRIGTTFISTYDFVTNTWVECKGAELPLPLYRPNLLNLGNNKVMLIGGQCERGTFSEIVFIGCCYTQRRRYSSIN